MRRRLVVLVLCALPLQAGAAQSPEQAARACQAAQLKAAAKFMKSNFGCWSTLFKKLDEDRLLACFAKADEKFARAYDKALAKAGPGVCPAKRPAADLLPGLAVEVDDLVGLISSDLDERFKSERALHAALSKAVGSALGKALAAQSNVARKGVDDGKTDKAVASVVPAFFKAILKAARKGAPYFGVGPDIVADEIERIVTAVGDALGGVGTIGRFSVSGRILAAAATFVDSDVNDPSTLPRANGDPENAQQIAVPATIGGYLNTPLSGPDGNSFAAGDESDAYRASLRAGQRITLLIGEDPAIADLDLCLFEVGDTQSPVDCSLGTADREELIVPFDGEFFIQVFPWEFCDCGSNYALVVGQDPGAASGDTGLRLSDEFVAGEVIVTARQAGGVRGSSASGFAAGPGLTRLAGRPEREMLFALPSAALRASAAGAAGGGNRFARPAELARGDVQTILAVKELRRRSDVGTADLNYVLRASAVPNDAFFPLQWHYPLINLPAAWDVTTGSASVKVAVIDTGVLLSHPDLQGRLGSGYDFIRDKNRSLDGDGIDPDPDDPGDAIDRASSFHGTHVAGTVGAAGNNGTGVTGVAWNVELIPVRVLGLGGATSFDILEGVRFAAGLANGSGTSNKADIINLSLGGPGFSQTAQNVYAQARAAGVLVVAAAGNENSSQLMYPASYEGVVSVSAVDPLKRRAPYSSFGSEVDVAAPGGDVRMDLDGDGYADGVLNTGADDSSGVRRPVYTFLQGTSMAAPHVAGVAALMKSVDPSLTPDEFDGLLASGALTQDLGAAGRDDVFGHGLIDARKAVIAAAGVGAGAPLPVVSPGAINLGPLGAVAVFGVSNAGGGALSVDAVSDDAAWLEVSADAVDADGLGSYRVTVDRAGLAPGTYSATIQVETSAATLAIPVVMSVLAGGAVPSDAGFHYVLLVDPDSLRAVGQADVPADDGVYVFDLPTVPAGRYLLVAGSDPDNDGFICGPTEACGAFPTLDLDEPLVVEGDVSGLEFTTSFATAIQAQAAGSGGRPQGIRLLRRR